MRVFISLLLLFSLVSLAIAEDHVCEDVLTPGKYRRYVTSVDPTRLTLGANEVCTPVPKADTPVQRELNGIPTATGNTILLKYRKVANGLTVEMTQPEKDVVDAAITAAAAVRQAFLDELTDEFCGKASLAEINTAIAARKTTIQGQITTRQTTIQAQIDALSGAVTLAMLKNVATALNNNDALIATNLVDEVYTIFQKAFRCGLARTKARQ